MFNQINDKKFVTRRLVWLGVHSFMFFSFFAPAMNSAFNDTTGKESHGVFPLTQITMAWQAPTFLLALGAIAATEEINAKAAKSAAMTYFYIGFICNMIIYNYYAIKRHEEGRQSWLSNMFSSSDRPARSGSGVYFTKTENGNTIVKPDGTPQIFTGYPDNPNTHSKWN